MSQLSGNVGQTGGVVTTEFKKQTTTTTVAASPAGDAQISTSVGANVSGASDLKQTTSAAAAQVGQAARADAADLKANLGVAAVLVSTAAGQVGSAVKADASHLASETGDALCKVKEQAKHTAVETGAVVNAKLDQAAAQGEVLIETAKSRAAELGTAVYAKACDAVAMVAGSTGSALHAAETRLDALQQSASAKAVDLYGHQAQLHQQALLEGIPAQQQQYMAGANVNVGASQGLYPAVPAAGAHVEVSKVTTTSTTATGNTQNLMD